MAKKRIAQIGTFDVENFGDLLFPDVLKYYMQDEYDIDLFSPMGGIKPFDNVVVYPISKLESMITEKKYDAIIIGGGDLLRTDSKILIKNEVYEKSNKPSLELWADPIIFAKKHNIPVLFNAIGVPNDFDSDEKHIIKDLLSSVDYLTVRDSESKKSLEKIGIFNVKLVPDSILSIKKMLDINDLNEKYNNLVNEKIIPKLDHYLVFQHNSTNIEDKNYYNNIISLIKEMAKDNNVLLMPIGYVHDDDKILKKIYQEKIKNVYLVNYSRKLTPYEMISILNSSDGYVGTSMHGAVISTAFEKKIMILNSMNSKKLHGFANLIGKSDIDVNNSDYLLYFYKNVFNSQKLALNKNLLEKIYEHFANMKSVIENFSPNEKKDKNINDFISLFYHEKNSRELLGQYYTNEEGYLNRNIFKYKKIGENQYNIKITSKYRKIYLYPVINNVLFIEKFVVNGNEIKDFNKYYNDNICLELDNDKGYLEFEITCRDITNNDIVLASEKQVILKDELQSLKKAYEISLNEYKELEKKYCDELKNK